MVRRSFASVFAVLLVALVSSLGSPAPAGAEEAPGVRLRSVAVALSPPASALLVACPDHDGDGWHDCAVPGCDPTGLDCGDCDDQDEYSNPGETETCNHGDDDCDGAVDEGSAQQLAAAKVLDPARAAGDQLGTSIAEVGDVTGDGVPDFVVGAPFVGPGHVVLFSGADRSRICATTDGASGDRVGATVAGIGDVTGDGVPDFAASAPRAAATAGAVAVYSGDPADGCALVRRCVDPQGVAGEYLGSDAMSRGQGLAGFDDVTGDGIPEILAGSPLSDRAATDAGLVVVFDPTVAPSCAVVHRAFDPGPQAGAQLGQSVAGLGDVTGDGISDFAAGANGYDDAYANAGAVEIFSGATGTAFVRRLLDPDRGSDGLGYALDSIEDRDGDGHRDVVAGAPYRDTVAGSDAGQVLVLSSQGGSNPVLLRADEGTDGASSENLGRALAVAEDADGDGVAEILAGANNAYSSRGTRDGHAVLFSGAAGSVLAVFEDPDGAYDDDLGWAVEATGDLTGDDAGDFLAGAPVDDVPKTGTSAGSVVLFLIESDCDGDAAVPFDGDCDDQDADRFPANLEVCDGTDNDCDGVADEDGDGDGHTVCAEEAGGCDPSADLDPAIHPGAEERCNGIDDDCNGAVDEGEDLDGDGYETPCDCNDDPAAGGAGVHPGAAEICNHADENCGAVDEGFASVVTTEKRYDTSHSGAFFGRAVAALDDVDGDGVPDIAVGYLGDHTAGSWTGSVMLYSGADRSFLCRAVNDQAAAGDQLGFPLVAVADADGDAVPDFAAAAYLSDARAYEAGEILLFSGADCSVIRHLTDPAGSPYDHLGEEHGLAAFDLDGDGLDEILAGAQYADVSGRTDAGKGVVFDGADGSVRFYLADPLGLAYDRFGASVAGLPDVTGDGIPDIVVGETRDDWVASDGGGLLLFSGADGSFVRRLSDPLTAVSDYLGWSVAGIGDLDADGWPEIVAGVPKKNPGTGGDAGQIVVFSGWDGSVLYRAHDPAGGGDDNLGWSVAVSPDVDGDGAPEILAGAPYGDTAGGSNAGRAVLFSGTDGSKIRSFEDPNGRRDDHAGFSVAAIGDLSGDGNPEALVSASDDDLPKYGNDSGSILVFVTESDCDGDGYGPTGADCDDTDADIHEGHADICDGKDNDCDLQTDEDEDADGYDACAEAGCDPAEDPNRNPGMYPGAPERCNGIDDDCNGSIDDGDDLDGDGYESPCDCNDDPAVGASIHPGAVELCNHADEDCDAVDEGFDAVTSTEAVADRYPAANDRFGTSMATVGDVNGDGVPDLAIGAPYDDTPGWDWGQVTLLSGADRSVICRTAIAGRFGETVAGVGDLNLDLVPDVAAGAPGADAVVLVSGADCTEFARCEDPYAAANALGSDHGLAAFDLDADGTSEILAGAPGASVWEHHAGAAFAFSYDHGTGQCDVRFEMHDPDAAIGDALGYGIAGIGDVTGDGVPDVVVGEPYDASVTGDANGAVLVFSGDDGSFYARWTDPTAATRDHLGKAVAALGDVDEDGWPDLAASVEWGNLPLADAGHLVEFSGKDGTVLRRISDPDATGGERLGWSMAALDDLDGDGLRDLVAGAYFAAVSGVTQAGRAVVFSGGTGSKIATFENPDPAIQDYFGYAVASAGDLTGDGLPEILVGTPYKDGAAGVDTGSIQVYALESDCDGDLLGPYDDCDDADADVWSAPSEALDLVFASDKQTMTWTAPLVGGNSSGTVAYDTLRADLAGEFDAAACVETDGTDLTSSDAATPGVSAAFYYLVRAQNQCGDGDLGLEDWGADPTPRTGRGCP